MLGDSARSPAPLWPAFFASFHPTISHPSTTPHWGGPVHPAPSTMAPLASLLLLLSLFWAPGASAMNRTAHPDDDVPDALRSLAAQLSTVVLPHLPLLTSATVLFGRHQGAGALEHALGNAARAYAVAALVAAAAMLLHGYAVGEEQLVHAVATLALLSFPAWCVYRVLAPRQVPQSLLAAAFREWFEAVRYVVAARVELEPAQLQRERAGAGGPLQPHPPASAALREARLRVAHTVEVTSAHVGCRL